MLAVVGDAHFGFFRRRRAFDRLLLHERVDERRRPPDGIVQPSVDGRRLRGPHGGQRRAPGDAIGAGRGRRGTGDDVPPCTPCNVRAPSAPGPPAGAAPWACAVALVKNTKNTKDTNETITTGFYSVWLLFRDRNRALVKVAGFAR